MRVRAKTEYRPGRIKALVENVARYVVKNPGIVEDLPQLHATIAVSTPGYGNGSECFNCGHHMKVAVYTAGLVDGLLLVAMARQVRQQLEKAGEQPNAFTHANRVHVPTLAATDAMRHSITRIAYLGLAAQSSKAKHSGYWVITHWGWKALRGDPVPRSAKYWRGKLLERSEETTTLAQMFSTHVESVRRALERRQQVQADYRADVERWKPTDWVDFSGPIDEYKEPIHSQQSVGTSRDTLGL